MPVVGAGGGKMLVIMQSVTVTLTVVQTMLPVDHTVVLMFAIC